MVLVESGMNFKTNKLEIIREMSQEWYIENLSYHGYWLRNIKNQTFDICVKAIQIDAMNIQYVQNQTPELCLYAANLNGLSLMHIREQTEEVCIAAVKENADAFGYIREQTYAICLAAVSISGCLLKLIDMDSFSQNQKR